MSVEIANLSAYCIQNGHILTNLNAGWILTKSNPIVYSKYIGRLCLTSNEKGQVVNDQPYSHNLGPTTSRSTIYNSQPNSTWYANSNELEY